MTTTTTTTTGGFGKIVKEEGDMIVRQWPDGHCVASLRGFDPQGEGRTPEQAERALSRAERDYLDRG